MSNTLSVINCLNGRLFNFRVDERDPNAWVNLLTQEEAFYLLLEALYELKEYGKEKLEVLLEEEKESTLAQELAREFASYKPQNLETTLEFKGL